MTDNTQELDEILGRAIAAGVDINFEWDGVNEFNRKFGDALKEARQAILDWHNKQIEQATDSVEAMVSDIAFKEGINHVTMGGEWVHRDEVNKQIEAVLDRLQKASDDCREGIACMVAIEAERNKLKEIK